MSYLFEIKNKSVLPKPETLCIKVFYDIWKRDKSKDKTTALKELAYVEFMTSGFKSNPFFGYPEDKKESVIIDNIFGNDKWKPDKLVKNAINILKEIQTDGSPSYTYYMSAKIATEKMKDFFEKFDLNERNEKTGNPIYKPHDVTKALNDTENVLKNLNALRKKVDEELYDSTKIRSGKTISPFAKPMT